MCLRQLKGLKVWWLEEISMKLNKCTSQPVQGIFILLNLLQLVGSLCSSSAQFQFSTALCFSPFKNFLLHDRDQPSTPLLLQVDFLSKS